MNVLEQTATWVDGKVKPTKSGIYMTYHHTGGTHAWCFNVESNNWGDGLYTPDKGFKWLNVRIDLSK